MRITTRQIVVTGALAAIVILLGAPPLRLGFIPFVLGVAVTILHIPVIIGAVLEGPWVGLALSFLFGLFSLFWSYVAPTGPFDAYFQNPLISIVPRLFIGLVAYAVYRLVGGGRHGQKTSLWPAILVLAAIIALAVVGPVLAYTTPVLGGDAGLTALVLFSSLALGLLALAGLGMALWRGGEIAAVGAAAVAGTLTNTVLVLLAIGGLNSLILADAPTPWSYLIGTAASAPPMPWPVILGAGLVNGLPEVIAAILLTVAIVAAWKQIEFGRKGARILHEE